MFPPQELWPPSIWAILRSIVGRQIARIIIDMSEPTRAQHIQEALSFLKGVGPDAQGARMADLLSRNAEQWKRKRHQDAWIFPIPQTSLLNPWVPLLDSEALAQLGRIPAVRAGMLASWTVTLGYLGLVVKPDGRVALSDPTTGPAFVAWFRHAAAGKGFDNVSRVQHMLRSMVFFGLIGEVMATVQGIKAILGRHCPADAELLLKVLNPAEDLSPADMPKSKH